MKLKMMLLGAALALCSVLGGCATSGQIAQVPDYTKEIGIACSAVSASFKVIRIANDAGKITKVQQDQVLAATKVTDPICGADKAPTLTSVAYDGFLQAVAVLQGIAAKAH